MIESWQHEHEELVDECEAAGRDIVSPSCRAPVGGPERTRSWRTMPWESADRCVRPSRCFAWLSSVELDVARLCAIQIWVGFRLWRGSDFGGVQILAGFRFPCGSALRDCIVRPSTHPVLGIFTSARGWIVLRRSRQRCMLP